MVFFQTHGLTGPTTFLYHHVNDLQFPLHFHVAYECILVHEGMISVDMNDTTYNVSKEQLIFIHSHQVHRITSEHHSKVTILLFSTDFISDFDQQYKERLATSPVISYSALPKIEKLQTVYHQKAFLYDVLSRLISQSNFIEKKATMNTTLLHDLLLYVDNHYDKDCSLKRAATILDYDYTYVSQAFKQMTSLSFTDYLNQYRVSQAINKLTHSELTISEISRQCGYETLRTFNRNFLKYTNMTASDYRKQYTAS
ncbi:AraC family transcriptional regulator [Halolactibacillus sp. JCM 19043]|uniref:helix-turn-helix domain-containing protein n=1 Tax=Halolactibacillus sp. JCM 19043 TaxID=1460638 RepID=UPI000781FFB6|nr:helix-turn-helix domain-containing protein [Halolactibacillus sp. JCM 19043]